MELVDKEVTDPTDKNQPNPIADGSVQANQSRENEVLRGDIDARGEERRTVTGLPAKDSPAALATDTSSDQVKVHSKVLG